MASDETDLTIAVNLNANIPNSYSIKAPKEQKNRFYQKTKEVVDKAKEMIGTQHPTEQAPKDIFYILNKSLDATQSIIIENTMKAYKT